MQADWEAIDAIRRLVQTSQTIPAYKIINQIEPKLQAVLLGIQNSASNAFQLMNDGAVASNGHSKMLSVSQAVDKLRDFQEYLKVAKSYEQIDSLIFEDLMSQSTHIIEFISDQDADEEEGF